MIKTPRLLLQRVLMRCCTARGCCFPSALIHQVNVEGAHAAMRAARTRAGVTACFSSDGYLTVWS